MDHGVEGDLLVNKISWQSVYQLVGIESHHWFVLDLYQTNYTKSTFDGGAYPSEIGCGLIYLIISLSTFCIRKRSRLAEPNKSRMAVGTAQIRTSYRSRQSLWETSGFSDDVKSRPGPRARWSIWEFSTDPWPLQSFQLFDWNRTKCKVDFRSAQR